MNIFGLTPGELILIMMVAMVVIGPEKLPETAASIGKWVREFRRVTSELTQQFADENPFTEIQRAFSLTELTNSLNAPLPGTESDASDFAGSASTEELSLVAATSSVATTESPFRSSYFDQPVGSTPVEDSWTHSGLDDNIGRYGLDRTPRFIDGVLDEWAHGVPLFEATPVQLSPDTESTVEDQPETSYSAVELNGSAPIEADSLVPVDAVEVHSAVVDATREVVGLKTDPVDAPAAPAGTKTTDTNLPSAVRVAAGSAGPDRTSL